MSSLLAPATVLSRTVWTWRVINKLSTDFCALISAFRKVCPTAAVLLKHLPPSGLNGTSTPANDLQLSLFPVRSAHLFVNSLRGAAAPKGESKKGRKKGTGYFSRFATWTQCACAPEGHRDLLLPIFPSKWSLSIETLAHTGKLIFFDRLTRPLIVLTRQPNESDWASSKTQRFLLHGVFCFA